jgi:Protein of unknown function (DUF4238)
VKVPFNPKTSDKFDYYNYMAAKFSKKHHYLPVFYLNGFTNSNGKLFVYNKLSDTILKECTPSSIFFEKDLNNFKHEGKIVLSLEDDFFMRHDSKASTFLYNYLINNTHIYSEDTSAEYKFELTWFIVNLFWRIPNSNKYFEELIIKNGIHNKYFQIINSKTNLPAPKETLEKIQSDILNKKDNIKIFKRIFPFISADSEEILRIMEISKDFTMSGEYKLITGDNPFISNCTSPSLDNILGEFFFPFSHNRLLIAAEKVPAFINMHLLMNINLTILHQSERFVCSHDINNLKYVIKFYKIYKEENMLHNIAQGTFELLKELSLHNTLEDYLNTKR